MKLSRTTINGRYSPYKNKQKQDQWDLGQEITIFILPCPSSSSLRQRRSQSPTGHHFEKTQLDRTKISLLKTYQFERTHISVGKNTHFSWKEQTHQLERTHISVGKNTHISWNEHTYQLERTNISVGKNTHISWKEQTYQLERTTISVGKNKHFSLKNTNIS